MDKIEDNIIEIEKRKKIPMEKWAYDGYLALAREYQRPDKFGGNEEKMKNINAAMDAGNKWLIFKELEELSAKIKERNRKIAEEATETEKKTDSEKIGKSRPVDTIKKADMVSEGLKTINIGKDESIKMVNLNKKKESPIEAKPTPKEITLDDLKEIKERKSNFNVINFKGLRERQPDPVTEEKDDFTYEEVDLPGFSIDEYQSSIGEEAMIDREPPILKATAIPENENIPSANSFFFGADDGSFNQTKKRVIEIEEGLKRVQAEQAERMATIKSRADEIKDTVRKDDIRINVTEEKQAPTMAKLDQEEVISLPGLEAVEAPIEAKPIKEGVLENINESVEQKIEVPIDVKPIGIEESPEVTEAIKGLASKELIMDSLWKKILKGKELAGRFNIKEAVYSEITREYDKVRAEYDHLKERLVNGLRIKEEQLEREIHSKKQKLGEIESELKRGKVREYLSHSRKIIDYQIESLAETRGSLFEKMRSLAKNRNVQVVIGAALVGIAIAAPPTGFINLVTGGALPGFLPEALGPFAKAASGVIGGYLVGSIAQLRKDNNTMNEEQMKPGDSGSFFREEGFTSKKAPKGNFASSINYLTLRNPRLRNNFLMEKIRFEES
ncbi:MAG: hypothetical protein PHW52_01375 [Candidatus Pacebacteria bacterium]|nr:hypothetical protein [Candidatus Paceibacterota bacterium]